MLTHLLKDDQESVRKLALDSMPAFAKALAETEVAGDVLDAASAVIGDRSWRVRHAAAAKTPALAEAFGPSVTESHLVKSFVSLLQVCSSQAALFVHRAILLCFADAGLVCDAHEPPQNVTTVLYSGDQAYMSQCLIKCAE